MSEVLKKILEQKSMSQWKACDYFGLLGEQCENLSSDCEECRIKKDWISLETLQTVLKDFVVVPRLEYEILTKDLAEYKETCKVLSDKKLIYEMSGEDGKEMRISRSTTQRAVNNPCREGLDCPSPQTPTWDTMSRLLAWRTSLQTRRKRHNLTAITDFKGNIIAAKKARQ